MERFLFQQSCPDCEGARLRPESRAVTVCGVSIVSVSHLSLVDLALWINALHTTLPGDDWLIAEPIVTDLVERVKRLVEVGLGYLTLERGAPSLSAGEAQRLRLAALLGSGLTGVLYVLDEPTIGLHPRDNARLIRMLRALRDLGNTVLVIEHDLEMIAAADFIADFGPGAGRFGGQVVAQGSPAQVAACAESLTGQYLSGAAAITIPARRRVPNGAALTIRGAREHNLKNITARIPLGVLVAISGVSGSGKSSLMFDILDRAARQRFYGANDLPGEHDGIDGWEHLDKIITIDQAPLGRSTRSNAATYTDAFTAIREVFAATPEAKLRGLTAQYFSFNVPGGRCERCEGSGTLTVEMHFMSDVEVRCPACRGRRYKREVLAVEYNGYNIAQVLDLTIAEALPVFASVPPAVTRLKLMDEVGMGYLQLGQPASTFSGGEAQRVKLSKELARRSTGRTLYLLDEPSTGLHNADTAHLMLLLQRLVDSGNTVVVIEHNLDVIKCADWVIDLGPEGGEAGGQIIAQGPPEAIAQTTGSFTGELLRKYL
jgi:excinuclease ABC subunit A